MRQDKLATVPWMVQRALVYKGKVKFSGMLDVEEQKKKSVRA